MPISANSNAEAIALGLSITEGALQIGQLAVEGSLDYLSPRAGPMVTCQSGGMKSAMLTDNDGDFTISSGDTLTIDYVSCYQESIDDLAIGRLIIDLDTFSLTGSTISMSGTLATDPGFSITDRSDPNAIVGVEADLAFSFSLDIDEILEVTASGNQSLALTVAGITETITGIDIQKTASPPPPNISGWSTVVELLLSYDSELLGGTFTCQSTDLRFSGDRFSPSTADVTCRGQGNSAVRVVNRNVVEVDGNGNGNFAAIGNLSWADVTEGFLGSNSDTDLGDLFGDLLLGTIELTSNDIVYDATRSRALATTTAADGRFPNALVEVDTTTGAVSQLIGFTATPNLIRLPDDGSYIYVSFVDSGTIHRYDGSSAQLIDTVDVLYDPPLSDQEIIVDIAISPVDADLLAVVFRYSSFVNHDVTIVADMQQRPSTYRDIETGFLSRFDYAIFDSTGSVVHVNGGALLDFDANGFSSVARHRAQVGFPATRIGQTFYGASTATDEATLVRVGEYVLTGQVWAFDQQADLALFLSSSTLYAHDLDRYTWDAEYDLNIALQQSDSFSKLITGGGLVFLQRNDVINTIEIADIVPTRQEQCFTQVLATLDNEPFVNHRCTINTAVFDDVRGRLYGAIPGDYGTSGNSIVVIDNLTDTILQYVPVGAEPNKLALSSDRSTLFVSYGKADIVSEIALDTLTITRNTQIPLSGPPSAPPEPEPQQVINMQASTFDPDLIVVELNEGRSAPSLDEYVAISAGTVLPDTLERSNFLSIQGQTARFGTAGELFNIGYVSSTNYNIEELFTVPTGLTAGMVSTVADSDPAFSNYIIARGLAIFSNGDAVDLGSMTTSTGFDLTAPVNSSGGSLGIVDDEPNGHVYFSYRSSATGQRDIGIARYNAATGALEASEDYEAFYRSFAQNPLFDVGIDQLGFVASESGGLYIVDKSSIN